MFHVNIVHTNKSHVDIIMLRVDIYHLGYKGQKYGGILMPATSKINYVNTQYYQVHMMVKLRMGWGVHYLTLRHITIWRVCVFSSALI